ncbi:hypothetical protein L7F22_021978 [Adiantum nelumboides]|nr:hypothetical protein [Adiantum nelumboides]
MTHTRRHTHMHLPNVMGCTKSKEQKREERSFQAERKDHAWEAMLTRGLGLSLLDSNIKRLDTGYIASVFSTNYATALRRAPLRSTKIDMDDLLIPRVLPGTEACAALERYSKKMREHACARRSSLSDLTFMQPLLSNDIEKASIGENMGGDTESEVQFIKSLDSTEDLDGKGILPKMESPSKTHPEAASLMDPLLMSCQAKASHSACMLKRAVTFPRAKYFTFSDDTEYVDSSLNASKSSDSALEKNVCLVCDSADELVEPNLQPFLGTNNQDVPAESNCANTNGHKVDEPESAVPLWDATFDGAVHYSCMASDNTRKLHKNLSMNYIFNDDITIKSEQTQAFSDNNASPHLSMLHGRLHDEDDDAVSFSYKSSSSSCLSSPEFSSIASLKDWLPPDDPPLMLAVDFYRAGKETSNFDAFQASRTLLGPGLLPSTNRVLLKYVGADSRHPLDDATQEILQSPAQSETSGVATSGTPERATKQQPIEEPGAPRTMKGKLEGLYDLAELCKGLTL